MSPGGAQVVNGARQRGRGLDQPTGRIRDDLHLHPVSLVLGGVVRRLLIRDAVDRDQGAVEDRVRQPADPIHSTIQVVGG